MSKIIIFVQAWKNLYEGPAGGATYYVELLLDTYSASVMILNFLNYEKFILFTMSNHAVIAQTD